VRFVGRLIESGDREIDPCADRSAIGKRTRNFTASTLREMSAASTRRRSTRSAAQAGIQPAVAMSATTKKVRITRIVLLLYSAYANSRNGYFFNTAAELTSTCSKSGVSNRDAVTSCAETGT